MSDIIKIRRDSFANWQSANPTPALGEITYDQTNSQFRIGNGTDPWLSLSPVGNTPIADGDKGDIVVSGTGATWTVDAGAIGTSKLGGDITTAGKALLDDASAGDQRTTLGLGTMATQSAASVAITGGSISGITEAFSTPLNQAIVKVARNQTGSPIAKGQAVYINGSQGTHLTIALANNTSETTSSRTIGVAGEAIADNSTGFVICTGILSGLDTNLLTEGSAIWLNNTDGGLTTTKPAAPNHTVQVGWCVKQGSGSSGIIYVHIANGHELDELHDVKVTSVANNDLIRWDSATSTWKNFQGSTLFAATSHTHAISDVTGLSAALGTFASITHGHPLTDLQTTGASTNNVIGYNGTNWAVKALAISDTSGLQTALDGKAATSHTHAISDVTGLQTALDGKAASSHTHAISDVTGLQTALDGKAASSHTHVIADVTNLQTTLDGKAASSHTHLITDVTGLSAALASFASVTHGHPLTDLQTTGASTNNVIGYNGTNWAVKALAISDTSGLQTALDGKAATSHSHIIADVTGLQTALDGKAASTHSHAISDVTGLQTALDGKAASSHTHAISDVTNLTTELAGKASTTHASTHADGGADELALHGSQITTGTVAAARLGSGTAGIKTVLHGNGVWKNATCRPSVKQFSGTLVSSAVVADAASTLAGAANAVDLAPIRCVEDLSINSIQCNVTTAVASAKVRLAVYESNDDGWPTGTPIAESAELDCGSTGTKSTAVSFTLSGSKQYWLACWHSSTATLRSIPVGAMIVLGAGLSGTAQNNKVRLTGITYGTATAFRDFTANPVVAANLTAAAMPMVALQIA